MCYYHEKSPSNSLTGSIGETFPTLPSPEESESNGKTTTKTNFLYGIGQAGIDITLEVKSCVLKQFGLRKGDTNDVSQEVLKHLLESGTVTIETPGGSVSNTVRALGSLNEQCAFTGKPSQDTEYGKKFRLDLSDRQINLKCNDSKCTEAETTIIACIITPDNDRTFAICGDLTKKINKSDISEKEIKNSKYLMFSGYIWRDEKCIEAIKESIKVARESETKVVFTPSAPFCIEEHGDEFREMINDGKIDLVFTNESEAKCLFENIGNKLHNHLLQLSKQRSMTIAMTRGRENPRVYHCGNVIEVQIKGLNDDEIENTNGAGDAFAAGFLYGLSQNCNLTKCTELGVYLAQEVLQQVPAALIHKRAQEILKEGKLEEIINKKDGQTNTSPNPIQQQIITVS